MRRGLRNVVLVFYHWNIVVLLYLYKWRNCMKEIYIRIELVIIWLMLINLVMEVISVIIVVVRDKWNISMVGL